MSKQEILAELSKLGVADRREILERLCELEEKELLTGGATPDEMTLLDRELDEYRTNPEAGAAWAEVESRIRKPSRS